MVPSTMEKEEIKREFFTKHGTMISQNMKMVRCLVDESAVTLTNSHCPQILLKIYYSFYLQIGKRNYKTHSYTNWFEKVSKTTP